MCLKLNTVQVTFLIILVIDVSGLQYWFILGSGFIYL
jgi:hypothetical protein